MTVPSGIGKRSIESMFASATEDRISSEKASKSLKFTKRSGFSQYQIQLWYARLTAFRSFTLQIDNAESTTPTGGEIERFFSIISKHIMPKGRGAVSVSTIRTGLACLLQGCVFYHQDFRLTAHESSRIESLIQTLIEHGSITYSLKRERHWIGSVIVKRLVDTLYQDALRDGTPSWDGTLAKAQSIVLHAALGCRVGDIATSRYDRHDLPFLAYGDITMKLDGGSDVEHLCMSVTMRNVKGRKGIPLLNSSKRFSSINTLDSISLCPVKAIVIMALRFGNVDATNIEELLAAAAARHDRTVQWKNPRRPILPRFTPGGSVVPDQPAHTHQFNEILDQVALRAGIVARIRGHDLRRGSAQDIAAAVSKGTLPLFQEEVAAKELLSHDYMTMFQGVTKHYMGPPRHDLWKPRVENKNVDIFTAPLTAEVNKAVLTTRLSSATINSFCETYNLNPNERSQRLKATRKAKSAAHTEWMEEQCSATEPQQKVANGGDGHQVISRAAGEGLFVTDDEDEGPESADIANGPFGHHATLQLGEEEIISHSDHEEHREDDEADGRVSIFSTLIGAEAESDEMINPIAMNTLLECVSEGQIGLEPMAITPPSQIGQPSLEEFPTLTPVEFVRQFSAINLTRNHKIAHQGPELQVLSLLEMSGNSRNNATMFLFFCKYRQTKGCMYSTTATDFLEVHEGRCEKKQPNPPKPPKGPPKKEGPEMSKLSCPVQGCGKKFKTASNLLRHAKEHDWVKISCPYKCDEKVLYATRSLLDAHIQATHKDEFRPAHCPVSGCKSARQFKTLLVIQEHFTKAHGKMSVEEVKRLIEGTQERVDGSDVLDE